jgi:hypothetical protein
MAASLGDERDRAASFGDIVRAGGFEKRSDVDSILRAPRIVAREEFDARRVEAEIDVRLGRIRRGSVRRTVESRAVSACSRACSTW